MEQKFIDLDVFVPEPVTMKVNGVTYKVKEVTTETYLRILNLGKFHKDGDFDQAKEEFKAIFKDTVPSLPDEILENMNGAQVMGYLTFLVEAFMTGANDPNVVKPMAKK